MRQHLRSALLLLGGVLLMSCGATAPESTSDSNESNNTKAQALGATGALSTRRDQGAFVKLTDGRVLAIGGYGFNEILASCELYDPATGTWSLAGSMSARRARHAAVRLSDGRVLVVGGTDMSTGGALASAELYDPTTGQWSATGSMTTARSNLLAVRLSNGQVLAVGGMDANQSSLVSAELYDPATETWTATAQTGMFFTGGGNTATLLQDGRALLAGGPIPMLYNPTTGQWTSTATPGVNRTGPAATLLTDGRVLVVGGNASPANASAELFDPATGTWTSTGAPLTARGYTQLVRVADGTVLMAGGKGSNGASIASVERYRPATGTWLATPALLQDRMSHSLVQLDTGDLLIAGGFSTSQYDLTATELYASNACAPVSCQSQGAACGTVNDGCGGTLTCGTCATGLSCSGNNQCVDVTAPTVSLSTPVAGAVVRDSVNVGGYYSDNVGVTRLEVLVDGVVRNTINLGGTPAGAVGTSFYSTTADNGPRTVTLRATDTSGNVATSAPVSITVKNPVLTQAIYDATLKAPRCVAINDGCTSGGQFTGRATYGPEFNYPNTLQGTCADGTSGPYAYDSSVESVNIETTDVSQLMPGKTVTLTVNMYVRLTPAKLDLFHTTNVASPSWQYLTTLSPTGTGYRTVSTTFTLPAGATQAIRAQLRYSTFTAMNPCESGGYNDRDDLVFAVQPDEVAPTTALTAPADGATVSGTVSLTATAADTGGVARVEFYAGTTLLGSDTTAPYQWSWSSRGVANGSIVLKSRAYDSAGNAADSAPVTVTVDNDWTSPAATLTAPTDGAVLTGTTVLSATASDNLGVARVEFYAGTVLLGSDTTAPYELSWNTKSLANGSYSLTARAYDTAGNVGTSTAVTVTTHNDVTAPGVFIVAPYADSVVSGTVSVEASANDNVGVTRVELYAAGALLGTVTTAPYRLNWNVSTLYTGTYSVSARAYDAAGNIGYSSSVRVYVSGVTPPPPTSGASYDSTLKAPRCAAGASTCDSGTLLQGRAGLGPETNAPNTLNNSCADGTGGSYHSDESLDGLKVSTVDGTALASGKTVRIEAKVWAYSSYTSDKLDLYYSASTSAPSWVYLGTFSPTTSGSQTLSTTYVLPAGAQQAIRGVFRYGGSASYCPGGGYDDVDDLVFGVQ